MDVSHLKNGRTECVRPVSEESLAFVGTLLQEKPSREALDAVLAEHKARIKACKLGQGSNRHLLGLKLMAAKAGGELPEFYKDEGYQTFTTDFLSTSTVGDNSTVVNFAFAPTSVGGLGINYTITPEGWLRPLQKSPSFDNRNLNTGFRLFLFQISTDSTQTPS